MKDNKYFDIHFQKEILIWEILIFRCLNLGIHGHDFDRC